MGYRLNCLDEPVLIAVSKPLLTEFGINHRLESCEQGPLSLPLVRKPQILQLFLIGTLVSVPCLYFGGDIPSCGDT